MNWQKTLLWITQILTVNIISNSNSIPLHPFDHYHFLLIHLDSTTPSSHSLYTHSLTPDDISAQDKQDLESALDSVKDVLGQSSQSGFSDREVKDALWDTYFDVDQVVQQLLAEQEKRNDKAKKKAGEYQR